MKTCLQILACLLLCVVAQTAHAAERPPNIVFIMSDELAYYELSHMGNKRIHTPNIDKMATEGIRFTQSLAAAPVCAPLRGCLMTGKHMGHSSVRANDGGTPLRAEEETIASVLKQKGYATGGFGKWGAGGRGSTGVPEKHGFDIFFGYYDQVHAHSFYTPYLIRNSEEVVLKGNIGGRNGKSYSHYAIMDEALKFIRENKEKPFFCYLPITPPHGMYDIPADDPAWEQYRNDAWVKDPKIQKDVKNYAAMVTMVDNNLGQVTDLLKELSLEENTIVFFLGDNGGQDRFRNNAHPRGFFGPNKNPKTGVEFRGGKGNLYEGGLRIPFIVRWPGKIKPGRVSDLLCYQPDIMPTLAELTGTKAPKDTDGLSILPELLGEQAVGHKQQQHEMLYWEYGSQTAVRLENWKAIRPKSDKPWELYDLTKDISETTSVADQNPEILARMTKFAEKSHETARPGTYTDRIRHERDRKAKYGSTRQPRNRTSGKVQGIIDKHLVTSDRMQLVRFSSENRSNDRVAAYAIDGRPGTLWHSNWSDKPSKHPHELVIDLGTVHEITGFRYLARQDSGWNGAFAKTEFSVSNDPTKFPESVASATFTKTRAPQAADCKKAVTGRYVLVRNLSEVNGQSFGSAAEIGVIGSSTETAYQIKPISDAQAEEYKLDKAFYKKGTMVQDILIATSEKVSDTTHLEAAYQFDMIMKSINPQIAKQIRQKKVLCILIGHAEFTSDVPQFTTTKTGKDLDFYNWRQRGFLTHKNGRPTVVFAEEDVLEYEGGMQIESILVHEFGHVIHGAGFDDVLQKRLTDTFQRARAKGIWMDGRAAQRFRRVESKTPVSLLDALAKSFPDQPQELIKKCLDGGDILVNGKGTNSKVEVTKDDKVLIVFGGEKECYAHKNRSEYWAEGVQCWYNTNRTMDHDHNHIHTREQLKFYDPHLAKMCEEVLSDSPWRFVSPRERAGKGHLKNFDPKKAPKMENPEHIKNAALDYYDKYWKDYWGRLSEKHKN